MRKSFVLVNVFLIFTFCKVVFAQLPDNGFVDSINSTEEFKFRDMPDSHWAAPAVYKMVQLGITKGFPDGTFRGTKTITRYEIAAYMAKLADSLGYAAFEKVAAELKSDVLAEMSKKQEQEEFKLKPIHGEFESSLIFPNCFIDRSNPSSSGPTTTLFNYRLQTNYCADINKLTFVKINFDTMYSAFDNNNLSLWDMMDIEGKFKFSKQSPLTLFTTFGPGPKKILFGENVIPSYYETVYERPYSGIKIQSKLSTYNYEIGYYAQKLSSVVTNLSSEVAVGRISGKISTSYEAVPFINYGVIEIIGDYFYSNLNLSSSAKNFKTSLIITSNPFKNCKMVSKIKSGTFHNIDRSKLAFIQDVYISNLLNLDTDLRLNIALVGSNCLVDSLEQWHWLDTDIFMRPTKNSAKRFSLAFFKKITKRLSLSGKSSIDLSPAYKFGANEENSRLTLEGGLYLAVNENTQLSILYRNEQNPSYLIPNSDILTFSLSGKF